MIRNEFYLEQGNDAYEAGQFPEAIRLYRLAVDAAPKELKHWFHLVLALEASGELDSALKIIAELAPEMGCARLHVGDLYHVKGRILKERGDIAGMLAAYQLSLAYAPKPKWYHPYNIACAYGLLGDAEPAARYAELALLMAGEAEAYIADEVDLKGIRESDVFHIAVSRGIAGISRALDRAQILLMLRSGIEPLVLRGIRAATANIWKAKRSFYPLVRAAVEHLSRPHFHELPNPLLGMLWTVLEYTGAQGSRKVRALLTDMLNDHGPADGMEDLVHWPVVAHGLAQFPGMEFWKPELLDMMARYLDRIEAKPPALLAKPPFGAAAMQWMEYTMRLAAEIGVEQEMKFARRTIGLIGHRNGIHWDYFSQVQPALRKLGSEGVDLLMAAMDRVIHQRIAEDVPGAARDDGASFIEHVLQEIRTSPVEDVLRNLRTYCNSPDWLKCFLQVALMNLSTSYGGHWAKGTNSNPVIGGILDVLDELYPEDGEEGPHSKLLTIFREESGRQTPGQSRHRIPKKRFPKSVRGLLQLHARLELGDELVHLFPAAQVEELDTLGKLPPQLRELLMKHGGSDQRFLFPVKSILYHRKKCQERVSKFFREELVSRRKREKEKQAYPDYFSGSIAHIPDWMMLTPLEHFVPIGRWLYATSYFFMGPFSPESESYPVFKLEGWGLSPYVIEANSLSEFLSKEFWRAWAEGHYAAHRL